MSAADAPIKKKMYVLGTAALIISNEEMEDITKIVKSVEGSGLLIKGISETSKNKAAEQKGGFISMLLGILAAAVSGNALAEKGEIKIDQVFNVTSYLN